MSLPPSTESGIRTERTAHLRKQATDSLGKLEYGRWTGRVVSAFSSLGRKIKWLFGKGPSEDAALSCFESYRKSLRDRTVGYAEKSIDEVGESLLDYHVACVMEFHGICRVGEKEEDDGEAKLVVSGGTEDITESLLNEVDSTISCTTIGLAYKFLAEDRRLPKGFLERALIPDLIRFAMDEYGIDSFTAKKSVQRLLDQARVTSDRKVTFERVLEIKNKLRWLHSPLGKEPQLNAVPPAKPPALNPQAAALTPPVLSQPVKTNYKLDSDDQRYIQDVVDKGGGIKLENHDTRNKIKRRILRNKKNIGMNAFGMAVSAVLTGLATGGIGAAVTVFSYIAWIGAWSGGTELIRMIRAIRALQRAELNKDYRLDVNDLGILSELDEKKFRIFLKSMRYICSHETLTRVFNAFSELEKDAQARLSMTVDESSLDSVIMAEEGKARYLYRRRGLKEAFDFYSRFYQAASADVSRMEAEWDACFGKVFETTFSKMPPHRVKDLFNRAANDKRVTGRSYYFQTDQTDWLKSVLPIKEGKDGHVMLDDKTREELEKILDEELQDVELTEEERVRFNTHAEQVAGAYGLASSGAKAYLKVLLKGALRSTAIHGFKIGWHTIEGVPKIEISPYLPKPSLDGLAIFGFFFVVDLLLSRKNSQINQKRFDYIAGNTDEPAQTWNMGWRERTGREELNTIRKLAKDGLQDFESRILKLHDLHKQLLEDFRVHERLGNHLEAYEVAVKVLQWHYEHFMINQMMVGPVGRFYHSTIEKTEYWDRELADIIPPQEPF